MAYGTAVSRDRWWHAPLDWWWLDAPVAALASVIVALRVRPGTGADLLGKLSLSDRRAVYTDMLQLATIFAGFGGVIFAVYLGLQSRQVKSIRERLGGKLLSVWISAILTPWASAAAIILARILDRGEVASSNGARWIAIGALVVVATQIARVVWIFYQLAIVEVTRRGPTIPTSTNAPRIRRRAS